MTVAGVLWVLNEADIIERSIEHHLAQGLDPVYVCVGPSTDGTDEIAHELSRKHAEVVVTREYDDHMNQQHWVDTFAAFAGYAGADWIVPFDADEFWLPAPIFAATTVADVLEAMHSASIVTAKLWNHHDWDRKIVPAERLRKVAYRWQPGARIHPGNHGVDLLMPLGVFADGLEVRHLQYRSFEHFCRKVRERNARLGPVERARGDGAHHTRLDDATDDELRIAWDELARRSSVYDPIPIHRSYRLDP